MKLVQDISVTSRPIRIGPAFTPARLFAGGEAGAWFDPSDLATLFQDAAGSVPVTADGQPVGLVLDKSRGLAPGAELAASLPTPIVVNFGGSIGAWDGASRTMTNSGLSSNNSYPRFQFNLGLQANARYHVVGQLTGDIAALAVVSLTISGLLNTVTYDPATGAFEARQVSAGAILEFRLNGTIAGVKSVQIAAISVRELPGAHAAQATSTRRPTYRAEAGLRWLDFDGVDDLLVTSALDLTSTTRLSLFAGVRKMSDAVRGAIINHGAADARSFSLYGPGTGGVSNFAAVAGNTAQIEAAVTSAAPVSAVLTARHDIGGAPVQSLAVNGGAPALVSGGTGASATFRYTTLGIGGFATAERWFNGRLFGLVLRGAETSAFASGCAERYLAAKTGVSL